MIYQTTVQPNGKIEIAGTGLEPGDKVDVILVPRTPAKRPVGESICDILKDAPGGLMFKNKEDVDRYLAEEHASWER